MFGSGRRTRATQAAQASGMNYPLSLILCPVSPGRFTWVPLTVILSCDPREQSPFAARKIWPEN